MVQESHRQSPSGPQRLWWGTRLHSEWRGSWWKIKRWGIAWPHLHFKRIISFALETISLMQGQENGLGHNGQWWVEEELDRLWINSEDKVSGICWWTRTTFAPIFRSLLLPYLLCQVDKVLPHMHYSSQDPFSCPNVTWSGQPRWLHRPPALIWQRWANCTNKPEPPIPLQVFVRIRCVCAAALCKRLDRNFLGGPVV